MASNDGARPFAIAKKRTASLDAYHRHLRATFALSNRFAELAQSVRLFQEALALEPTYAPSWAGLAHAY